MTEHMKLPYTEQHQWSIKSSAVYSRQQQLSTVSVRDHSQTEHFFNMTCQELNLEPFACSKCILRLRDSPSLLRNLGSPTWASA